MAERQPKFLEIQVDINLEDKSKSSEAIRMFSIVSINTDRKGVVYNVYLGRRFLFSDFMKTEKRRNRGIIFLF